MCLNNFELFLRLQILSALHTLYPVKKIVVFPSKKFSLKVIASGRWMPMFYPRIFLLVQGR